MNVTAPTFVIAFCNFNELYSNVVFLKNNVFILINFPWTVDL